MPIAAIPFKSPPAFDLPPYVADSLKEQSLPGAFEQVEKILIDAQCADTLLSVIKDGNGCLRPASYRAVDDRVMDTLGDVYQEMADHPVSLDSDAGRANFFGQAVTAGSPLLMMGDVEFNVPDPFPTALRFYLLHGSQKNNIGFLYVFPVKDEAGTVYGAIAVHRWLASGPLNHDQPAITHALMLALAQRAAALAAQA
jgi:hypothetical protein